MSSHHVIETSSNPDELTHSQQECKASPTLGTIASSHVASDSICAVVVTFFPDQGLDERLRSLLPQVGMLVVVDNTPEESSAHRLKKLFKDERRVHIIENRINLGISAALNQGLKYALNQDFQWILTLDQDTLCYPDMVSTLLQAYDACEPKPAVIGGNYFDPRNGRTKVPEGRIGEFLEQKTVITSGSLIDAKLAGAIGGFREDYFIDQVDHEFCLRMRGRSHQVIISRKPVMEHSVGGLGGARLPFLGILPNHPPLRKYYITRNTVVIVSEYWHQEPEWCLRRIARLLLGVFSTAVLEKQRVAKILAFATGLVDGMNLRMGPCRHRWLNQQHKG